MGHRGEWQRAGFHVPLTNETVRVLATYKDGSYRNAENNYVFFETDGYFAEEKWNITPVRFVCNTYQEAEKKLKVMFWQYKTPHPQYSAE
jgi:hypothetical protein